MPEVRLVKSTPPRLSRLVNGLEKPAAKSEAFPSTSKFCILLVKSVRLVGKLLVRLVKVLLIPPVMELVMPVSPAPLAHCAAAEVPN